NLREGTHMHPAVPLRRQRTKRCPGDRPRVVVLDHEKPRSTFQQASKLARAVRIDVSAGGVVCPPREERGTRRRLERLLERVGSRAAIIDLDRDELEAERPDEVENAREAGILDDDPVAGAAARDEDALDAVERTGNDGEAIAGDAVSPYLSAYRCDRRGRVGGTAVKERDRIERAEASREPRNQLGIRVAQCEIADTLRHRRH